MAVIREERGAHTRYVRIDSNDGDNGDAGTTRKKGGRRWWAADVAATEELRRGQIVLVVARWVLIVVGLFLSLNAPDDLVNLQVSIVGLLAMAGMNFLLHTNLLVNKPASEGTLYLASVGDIALISVIVAITGGFDSYVFVFYYPAIVALSLVFPLRVTLAFTGVLAGLYAGVVLTVSETALSADTEGVAATLVTRLLTFAAVMTVSNLYRFVERDRVAEAETPGLGQ